MEAFNKLEETVAAAKIDYTKFLAGNKSAGTRLRLLMQDVKALAQEVRVAVQAAKA